MASTGSGGCHCSHLSPAEAVTNVFGLRFNGDFHVNDWAVKAAAAEGSRVWDSAVILARFLEVECNDADLFPATHGNKAGLAGKRCLELGCGLGVVGMAAQMLGARVLMSDTHDVMRSCEECVEETFSVEVQSELLAKFVADKGIKVVSFDLDQCAVAAHSRGSLHRDSLSEFLSKVTPDFVHLARALHRRSVKLAMATHSDRAETGDADLILGEELCQALLQHAVPELKQEFHVVAFNPRARGAAEGGDRWHKRHHMRTIAEHHQVRADQCLLFDDVCDNVQHLPDGCRGVQVDAVTGLRLSALPASWFDGTDPFPQHGRPVAVPLDWHQVMASPEPTSLLPAHLCTSPPDVLLGSDLIYNNAAIAPFVATLLALHTVSHPVMYMVHKQRHSDVDEALVEALKQAQFTVEEMPTRVPAFVVMRISREEEL